MVRTAGCAEGNHQSATYGCIGRYWDSNTGKNGPCDCYCHDCPTCESKKPSDIPWLPGPDGFLDDGAGVKCQDAYHNCEVCGGTGDNESTYSGYCVDCSGTGKAGG